MNYLVFLDTHAGELEKILSGIKTMLVKEFDPDRSGAQPVSPGDCLYFLRENDGFALRAKATVVREVRLINHTDDNLPHILKEMQPRLQLTEDQFNHWSAKQRAMLVEFGCTQKITVIRIAPNKVTDRSNWIAFEEFSHITQ